MIRHSANCVALCSSQVPRPWCGLLRDVRPLEAPVECRERQTLSEWGREWRMANDESQESNTKPPMGSAASQPSNWAPEMTVEIGGVTMGALSVSIEIESAEYPDRKALEPKWWELN